MVWLLGAALAAGATQRFDAGFLVLCLAAWMSRRDRLAVFIARLCLLVLCFTYSLIALRRLEAQTRWFDSRVGRSPVAVTGRVAAPPASQRYGVTFPLDTAIDGAPLRVLVRATRYDIRHGDRLRLRVRRVRPRHDMTRHLLSRRCAGIVRARFADIEITFRGGEWNRWRPASRVRRRARETLSRALGARSGVPLALVLGERGHIFRGTRERFQTLGIAHLLALSGMHLGVVIALFAGVARVVRRPAGVIVAVAVVSFSLVAGEIPSLQRATIMTLILILSRRIERPPQPMHALACALTAMLLAAPQLVFSAGFQLSFAAMAAVVLTVTRLLGRAGVVRGRLRRLLLGLWTTFAASWAVGLMLVPLQIHYFGEVPIAGPVATVLFFPVVAVVLSLSLALAAVGSIGAAGDLLTAALEALLAMLDILLIGAQRIMPDPITIPPPHPWLYPGAFAVALLHPRKRWGWPAAFALVALALTG